MNKLRIVIIVSHDKSDIYFANYLMDKLDVVGVVVENQQGSPDTSPLIAKALKLLPNPKALFHKLYDYFVAGPLRKNAPYNKPENKVNFGVDGERVHAHGDCALRFTTGYKDINDQENVKWLRKLAPDLIAVCGASILKDEILSIPSKGTLNLHGGLSQKYRGLYTTDWAIYNEEPEYVGATVHYVAPGIDDGDIVYQGRPAIELGDNPNSLYQKVVELGVKMMAQAIQDVSEGSVNSSPLGDKGDLYLESSFNSSVRSKTWKKNTRGVISDYLSNKSSRDKKVVSKLVNEYSKN